MKNFLKVKYVESVAPVAPPSKVDGEEDTFLTALGLQKDSPSIIAAAISSGDLKTSYIKVTEEEVLEIYETMTMLNGEFVPATAILQSSYNNLVTFVEPSFEETINHLKNLWQQ